MKINKKIVLKHLYDQKNKLFKMAIYYLKNEQDALDAIQETAYRVCKSYKKLKQLEYIDTWIIRILINICLDELERRKKEFRVFEENKNNETIVYENDFLGIEIEEALMQIKETYREVVILRYFEDLKVKEIGEVMGVPEGTIKTWLHRGMEELHQLLKEEGEKDA